MQLTVETLESREMAGSVYQPTGIEQLFLELLNVARADPTAYGESIGVDLAYIEPSQPLAINPLLGQAARLHSEDMSSRNFFTHNNPDGEDPGDRIDRAGYEWKAYGESLAGGYDSAAEALRELIIDFGVADLGHRNHLLSHDSISATLVEVGVGAVVNGSGTYRHYFTIDSARDYYTTDPHDSFLTGVIYDDADGDDFYSAGEGYGDVTVRAVTAGGGAEFTTTSFASGGYSLELPAGAYQVTVAGGGFPTNLTTDVTIASTNVKVDFRPTGVVLGTTAERRAAAELAVWSGTWQIDRNRNGTWDGAAGGDLATRFGKAGSDVPFAFDVDGNGRDNLAVMRKGKVIQIDTNGNFRWDGKRRDTLLTLGNGGDQPIVGDWDGDGRPSLGLWRNEDGTFHLDTDGDGVLTAADARFAFLPQQPGDVAIAGNWDGVGADEVGVFRGGNTFMLDANGDRMWDAATDREVVAALGSAQSAPADYTGNGRTNLAIFTGNTFQIDLDFDGSFETTRTFQFGRTPVPGNWA